MAKRDVCKDVLLLLVILQPILLSKALFDGRPTHGMEM